MQVNSELIDTVEWYTGPSCQLHLMLKSGLMHRFLGFGNEAFNQLSKSFGEAGHELVKREFAPKGRNWGDVSFKGLCARITNTKHTVSLRSKLQAKISFSIMERMILVQA